MEELIETIYNKLKKVNVKVVDQRPPVDSTYPFIKYSVNQPSVTTSPIIYTLTIDIWTKSDSYLEVERLASKVNEELYNEVVTSNTISIKLKKASENRIDDENLDIKRKRIIYQLRTFNY